MASGAPSRRGLPSFGLGTLLLPMAVFKATYDKLYAREGGESFFYKADSGKGQRLEGALLKLKKPNGLLRKGERWRRYWVTADSEYVCYFRNNKGNDDELRKLKPDFGTHARKRVPVSALEVEPTAGPDEGTPGFTLKAEQEQYEMHFACADEGERRAWVTFVQNAIEVARYAADINANRDATKPQ